MTNSATETPPAAKSSKPFARSWSWLKNGDESQDPKRHQGRAQSFALRFPLRFRLSQIGEELFLGRTKKRSRKAHILVRISDPEFLLMLQEAGKKARENVIRDAKLATPETVNA